MSTIDRAKKKHLRREKIARLSTSIVFRSIHSLDIDTYVYIYISSCVYVSLSSTYLYSPILSIISVFIAHHNTIRKICSPLARNNNENWEKLENEIDFLTSDNAATKRMENSWGNGGKFASRHLGSNSRRGGRGNGNWARFFRRERDRERKTFSRWLVEPWRESDAVFREGGRT